MTDSAQAAAARPRWPARFCQWIKRGWRRRLVSLAVFAAALLLPLPVAVGSLLLGAEALKDNVVDDAWDYVGQVSPQDVDTVYDQLEGYGIRIPGREEVHRILTATAP